MTSRLGAGGRLVLDCHNVIEVRWMGAIYAPVENGANETLPCAPQEGRHSPFFRRVSKNRFAAAATD